MNIFVILIGMMGETCQVKAYNRGRQALRMQLPLGRDVPMNGTQLVSTFV